MGWPICLAALGQEFSNRQAGIILRDSVESQEPCILYFDNLTFIHEIMLNDFDSFSLPLSSIKGHCPRVTEESADLDEITATIHSLATTA